MDLDVKWKDILAYHYEQCNKRFTLLRYYFNQELNIDSRVRFKQVMRSIINHHKDYLIKHALEKNIVYDSIDLNWIDDLHNKINHLNDFPAET